MLRKEQVDTLYAEVMQRYAEECPDVTVTKLMMSGIWYQLYGILFRQGEEEAKKYAKTAKLRNWEDK